MHAPLLQSSSSSNGGGGNSTGRINILQYEPIEKVQIVSHYLFVTYLDAYSIRARARSHVCLCKCTSNIQTKRKRRNGICIRFAAVSVSMFISYASFFFPFLLFISFLFQMKFIEPGKEYNEQDVVHCYHYTVYTYSTYYGHIIYAVHTCMLHTLYSIHILYRNLCAYRYHTVD